MREVIQWVATGLTACFALWCLWRARRMLREARRLYRLAFKQATETAEKLSQEAAFVRSFYTKEKKKGR